MKSVSISTAGFASTQCRVGTVSTGSLQRNMTTSADKEIGVVCFFDLNVDFETDQFFEGSNFTPPSRK